MGVCRLNPCQIPVRCWSVIIEPRPTGRDCNLENIYPDDISILAMIITVFLIYKVVLGIKPQPQFAPRSTPRTLMLRYASYNPKEPSRYKPWCSIPWQRSLQSIYPDPFYNKVSSRICKSVDMATYLSKCNNCPRTVLTKSVCLFLSFCSKNWSKIVFK